MEKVNYQSTVAIRGNHLLKFIFLFCITVLAIVSCEEGNSLNPEQNTPKLKCEEIVIPDCSDTMEMISIPLDTFSTNSVNPTNLGCSLLIDRKQDMNFVIRSKSEYDSLVLGCDSIPTIDFKKCTLLAGQKYIHWCCAAKLVEQEVVKDCKNKQYVYRVIIYEPEEQFHSFSTFYYFALIPRIESDYDVQFDVTVKEK
ncbi:MAG: hypothetical protein IID03_10340 [Candidatus Dadabacteria bacterium]|nr:hypothetical protein [Candidatus Dadabacteria bacterium]